jgi:hypothetical protein
MIYFDDNVILGGIEREKDGRDFSLEKAHELLGSITDRPNKMEYPKIEQVFQKSYPACGSHSGVHLKEIQEGGHLSPAYLWKKIKMIDGYTPEVGTDMRSIFKCLQKNGVCLYDLLPNDYTLTLAQYSASTGITEVMEADAQPRIIDSYAFLTDLSIGNIKTQSYLNKAVLLLIRCDDGFFHSSYPTFTEKKYGHFVVACGYDDGGVWVVDSTEVAFPYKYIKNEYQSFIKEAGTCVDLPNEVVEQLILKKTLLDKILELMKKLTCLKR